MLLAPLLALRPQSRAGPCAVPVVRNGRLHLSVSASAPGKLPPGAPLPLAGSRGSNCSSTAGTCLLLGQLLALASGLLLAAGQHAEAGKSIAGGRRKGSRGRMLQAPLLALPRLRRLHGGPAVRRGRVQASRQGSGCTLPRTAGGTGSNGKASTCRLLEHLLALHHLPERAAAAGAGAASRSRGSGRQRHSSDCLLLGSLLALRSRRWPPAAPPCSSGAAVGPASAPRVPSARLRR